LCSPFRGYTQADLAAAVSNPFNPPPPGSDDPHQAVDLAVQQDGIALAGGPVQAVIGGRVAGVIEDRFPYGNALFVETSIEELPTELLGRLQAPTLAPTLELNPVLTCPLVTPLPNWDFKQRSLYLLYAHLEEKPTFQVGKRVECGAPIGTVGQSGNALNPHLHLEVRIGPAGVRWNSMAHYETRATAEEMFNYCAWRVSGAFQLVDPMRLLSLMP
jgi:murein DD-endopeptidase MepM/ murein hydrolase activator NlpD